MKAAVTTLAALLTAAALGACGESDEEKAQTAVCNARDNISQEIDELKGLTPQTFSAEAVGQSLQAIESDLSDIANAQEDLSDERREQVESATKAFAGQVEDIAKQAVASASAGDAASQLTAALQQLASSYEQAFSRVDCS